MTMLPNPTDLGTFQSRAADINRRALAAKHRRDQQFTALIALHMAVALIAGSFLAFGLPEQQRLDRINQEQITWAR